MFKAATIEAVFSGVSRWLVRIVVKPFVTALVEEEVVKQLLQKKEADDKSQLEKQYSSLSRNQVIEVLSAEAAKELFDMKAKNVLMEKRIASLEDAYKKTCEDNLSLRRQATETLRMLHQKVQYLYNLQKGKAPEKLPEPLKKRPQETKVDTIEWGS